MSTQRHLKNAAGPFYVVDGCCNLCGVPEGTAPDLFGVDDEQGHCFVKRQPQTAPEVDRMLLTIIQADLGCIRYGGQDAEVVRRLVEQGESGVLDGAPPNDVRRVDRNHIALRRLREPITADRLMRGFAAHFHRGSNPVQHKFQVVVWTAERCELRVAWFEDHFHNVVFQRSSAPEFDWLIVGLPYSVHDWLIADAIGEATYFEQSDWEGSRAFGKPLPW